MESKEKVYIDLALLKIDEIKEVGRLIFSTNDEICAETLDDLIDGVFTEGYRFLFYNGESWDQEDYAPNLKDKKEITLSEFKALFSYSILQ